MWFEFTYDPNKLLLDFIDVLNLCQRVKEKELMSWFKQRSKRK